MPTFSQLAPFLLLLAAVFSGAAKFGSTATSSSSPLNITWQAERLLEFKQGLSQVDMLSGWNASNLAGVCQTWKGVICSNISGLSVTGLNFTDFNVSGQLTSPLCQLPDLAELRLRSNWINQTFPGFLLQSCKELTVLDFSLNWFYGQLPVNISTSLPKLQQFNMEGNSFVGTIPADLGNLSQLQLLRLRGNGLSGLIPPELGRLSKLTILDLSYNSYTPQEIPHELGNLSSLQQWDLPSCNLIGEIPAWFGNLSHLWFLNLATNNLSGPIPPSLANLLDLTEIYLLQNNLTGPLPPFSNLPLLKVIQFQFNSLSGTIPAGFASLSSLQTLILDFNGITGSLPDGLELLPELSTFAVANNYLSGTPSSEWGLHSKLVQFDISSNSFTGTFPAHLCNGNALLYLALKSNQINGTIPEGYGACKGLLRFIVNENQLSGSVPNGLWMLPSVQVLDLRNNYLSGEIVFNITDASAKNGNLQTIYIDSNQFEGPIPNEVGEFWHSISKLTASHNHLSGSLPPEIGLLTSLQELNLSMNAISGEIPPSIGDCVQLTSLSLSQNDFSGTIPAQLSQAPNLNYLDLSRNHLNGSIPNAIAKSTYVLFDVSYNDLSGTVPAPLVSAFGPSNFEGNPKLCMSAELCSFARPKDSNRNHIKLVVPIVVLGACMALLCVALMARMYGKRSRAKIEQAENDWTVVSFQRLGFNEEEIYERLHESSVIGWGGSGRVYKVNLKEGGNIVAVKKLLPTMTTDHRAMMSNYGGLYVNRKDENSAFRAEMKTLGTIQHNNIVKLLCSCECKQAKLLVYEYMCNGSLGDVLHKSFRNELLCWATRFKIALGAAEALSYLHHDCVPPILHRDIKSNNILLDASFQAKLADFGVAKCLQGKTPMTGVVGSVGYIAPEYAYTLKVDEKSDVYSYGVVLLELLTGRSPASKELECDRIDLVKWVGQTVAQFKEDFWKVLDCRLEVVDTDRESLASVLKLALLCTCTLPRQRPSMRQAVELLRRATPTTILLSHQNQGSMWNKEKQVIVSIVT